MSPREHSPLSFAAILNCRCDFTRKLNTDLQRLNTQSRIARLGSLPRTASGCYLYGSD